MPSEINWGLANGPSSYDNALAQGFKIGEHIRKQRDEKEYKNALATVFGGGQPQTPQGPASGGSGIVATPEQQAESDRLAKHFGMEGVTVDDRTGAVYGADGKQMDRRALSVIAQHNPQLADRLVQREAEQQQAARTADVSRRAAAGDPAAMAELAGMDLNAWRGLQSDQRAQAAQEAKGLGNAALDVLNRPPEQRGQALMAYAQQMGNNPAILRVAQLPPDQQEAALRAAIAQADMIGKLHEMEQPHYQVIPEGGSLVDTSNPQAIQQYSQGMGSIPPPPPGFTLDQGGQTATPSATFSGSFRPVGINQAGITSTYRTPQHNRDVGGVRDSYHTRRGPNGEALAIDSVPPRGMSMAAYAAKLRRENPNLDVINEGDHVHIEPRG